MPVGPQSLALTTDLYELTMSAAYFEHDMLGPATFELFVRGMPNNRGYLLACGLEQALDYLESLRFTREDVDYLRGLAAFSGVREGFWDYLLQMRFTGEVWAVPEGTPVFAEEPLLRVTAPLVEAQVVESFLLAVVNFQTMIATKAARIVDAARGRAVADFGLRRAHGVEASFWAARASYAAGCLGTSNVEAARVLGIPPIGTAAHSFTLAFGDEEEAFAAYVDTFPESAVLLIDTYDTLEGARRAARFGDRLRGVRIDSGDLAALSGQVRRILDRSGCAEAKIVVSGDLNEYKIDALLEGGAPIDMFGVGTEMVTSHDAPALPGVYKLVAMGEGEQSVPRAKRSEGKVMFPGGKQVYRRSVDGGGFAHDVLATATECPPDGCLPLLEPVMESGGRLRPSPSLEAIRARASAERALLPEGVRRLVDPQEYPVIVSPELKKLTEHVVGPRGRAEDES